MILPIVRTNITDNVIFFFVIENLRTFDTQMMTTKVFRSSFNPMEGFTDHTGLYLCPQILQSGLIFFNRQFGLLKILR